MTRLILGTAAAFAILAFGSSQEAAADKLDDVIASGKLRCGVLLDLPPVGYRDASNNPVGYDIEVCQDMAKALGVKPVIVETPSPDRIPAVLSDRVDVSISSATNSLERAKVVAFSVPYQVWSYAVVVRKGSGIKTVRRSERQEGRHRPRNDTRDKLTPDLQGMERSQRFIHAVRIRRRSVPGAFARQDRRIG